MRRLTYNLLIEFQQKEAQATNQNNAPQGQTTVDLNNLEQAKRLMNSENSPAYIAKASKK